MFTGIVEALGTISAISQQGTNKVLTVQSPISHELKMDQSVSHQGVCLTVDALVEGGHRVVAVKETLERSNLGRMAVGDAINLERAMRASDHLDGHIVQGHVDATGTCQAIEEVDGSWYFTFGFDPTFAHMVVDKGSICIDGTSLTVIGPSRDSFRVVIVPYTYGHTTFKRLKPGDAVNLEFDILAKYLARYLAQARFST